MRILIATAVLALLTACGGGTSYDSADAVAEAAGFTDCEPDEVLGATDAVFCDGGRVSWFKHDEGKDTFTEVAKSVGMGETLVGDDWAIECESRDACDEAQEAIGGDYL